LKTLQYSNYIPWEEIQLVFTRTSETLHPNF
jgi:hypothetical protein